MILVTSLTATTHRYKAFLPKRVVFSRLQGSDPLERSSCPSEKRYPEV